MNYTINGNELVLYDGAKVTFDFPIKEAADVGDRVVVVLDVPPNVTMRDNVFAVDSTGDILWQIDVQGTIGGKESGNTYMDILHTEENTIWLDNWKGFRSKVDLTNGRILTQVITK